MIQGQNTPLIIQFDEKVSNCDDASASLSVFGIEQKQWNKSDMVISNNIVKLPITETQSLGFKTGPATLEIKFNFDDEIRLSQPMNLYIYPRYDDTKIVD